MTLSKSMQAFVALAMLAGQCLPASAVVRNFFAPRLLGDNVAFCTAGENGCGKPAADSWCRQQGYESALMFQRTHGKAGVSARRGVRHADTGDLCLSGDCLAFRQIKCQRAKGASS